MISFQPARANARDDVRLRKSPGQPSKETTPPARDDLPNFGIFGLLRQLVLAGANRQNKQLQVTADRLSKISSVIQGEMTTGFHFSGESDLDDPAKPGQKDK
jgi:hypothetical protein